MSRFVLAVGLGLGVAAFASSRAEALVIEKLSMHVPFAFEVGSVALPAGDYQIVPASILDTRVLEIRDSSGRRSSFFTVLGDVPVTSLRHAELVFDRYGSRVFLRAIRVPGQGEAALVVSSEERRAAREDSRGAAAGRP